MDILDTARARVAGRSFWQVRYRDGKTISEWEKGVSWEHIPRKGLLQGRLICPDGRVAVLGASQDCSDTLFQFKIGQAALDPGRPRTVVAHVMGILTSLDAACELWAWEWPGRLVGPITDNYIAMRYGGPVTSTLNAAVLGVRPD